MEDEKREVIPPRYGYYETHRKEPEGFQAEHLPEKHTGSSGFGKTLAKAAAVAIVFGIFASAAFTATNRLIGQDTGKSAKQSSAVSTTETVQLQKSAATDQAVDSSTAQDPSDKGIVAQVAQATMPSVVAITTVSVQEIPAWFGGTYRYQSAGSGSGILVGENEEELLIATNNHVVSGATTLSVFFYGSDVTTASDSAEAVSGSIKGTDETVDLAVVAVKKSALPEETLQKIKIAKLGDSDSLVVGEQVVAIGNALGYGQSVTSGWVSALNRTVTNGNSTVSELIQTDAAINPGNSGGALLNMSGELIGINSAKNADQDVEGMGYAIPISKASPILEELMNRKTREKRSESEAGYLGVSVTDLSRQAIRMYDMPSGAFVVEVFADSPAEQFGLLKGDIIQKLDGQAVSGSEDLIDKLQYYSAGEQVELVFYRTENGIYEEQTVTVTLGSREQ